MSHEMVMAPSGIGYPVWRSGDGTPLLLLHGFTGSHCTWLHLGDALRSRNMIVTLDLPGHGNSALPAAQPWTFAAVSDDLASIIASLPGGRANVLGYSMGGRIALALAVTHPDRVRSVILESATPGIADEQERAARRAADDLLAERILHEGVDEFVTHWEQLPMWESQGALPDACRERQRQIRLSHTPCGLAASLRVTGTGAQPSFWERLTTLKTPTLLIAGDLDHKFAHIASSMHEVLPASQLEIVPNAGHAVHLEQPATYADVVSRFLRQAEDSGNKRKGVSS